MAILTAGSFVNDMTFKIEIVMVCGPGLPRSPEKKLAGEMVFGAFRRK
jgi:hypothetical protein